MGFFDKLAQTAKNVSNSVANTATNVGSSAGVAMQDTAELNNLKMQVNVIEQELNASYIQIGRKYVEYVAATGDMPGIDISDLLILLDPKMTRKQELEQQIIDLEKRMRENQILREKNAVEQSFLATKENYDKALAMGIMTEDEYNYKLSIARKRVDNFDEIRRIEQQCSMGIITVEEKNARIQSLTE